MIPMSRFRNVALLAAATLPFVACCASAPEDQAAPDEVGVVAPSMNLDALQQAGIANLSIHGELYSGGVICTGQLTEAQMALLSDEGVKTFISLRVATENGAGWEEAYAAEQGVNFTRMEVAGAAGVTADAAKSLHETLSAADGPVVLYCGSSNRVGALLGIAAHNEGGMTREEALKLAASAGMTRLEPVVRGVLGM